MKRTRFARIAAIRKERVGRTLRTTGRFGLCLALLSQTFLIGGSSAFGQGKATSVKGTPASTSNSVKSAPSVQGNDSLPSERVSPISTSMVNVRDLAQRELRNARLMRGKKIERLEAAPAPMTINDSPAAGAVEQKDTITPPAPSDTIPGPDVPSPSPSTSFQGEFDEAVGGGPSGTFTIPPDTMGAVGLDKVVSFVNNNYVSHNKTTGARLSVVGLTAFWASTGATGVFDPRVQYDPYNNRWLVSAVSNAQTASSSVLVGVSQTSDPDGSYFLFRFIVGCAPGAPGCNAQGEWADFPMLGFNKNWFSVSWNQFTINTGAFVTGKILVLDYPTMRGGTATATLFSGAPFCLHPATTFSATENNHYYLAHLSSAGATYLVGTGTGTPATPAISLGATLTRPGGGWVQPVSDSLPQQCIPGVGLPTQTCPAVIRRIDPGDAFIRSNLVFRNGRLFYPQTISLPLGTPATSDAARLAAQWTVVTAATGASLDGGRVEDPTATKINGGKHYAYPSLGVNRNEDILFGFSEFESDDYADSGYTYRLGIDAAGTMRDPLIYKEGEDYYQKTFSGTRNRWGDYSHTVVDPSNDRDLWTIQEYAGLRVGATGQGANDSRWASWWAKVNAQAGPGELVISEFRLRGPSGANDEFIEIHNASGAPLTVTALDGSAGYSVVASDGAVRFTIPNGTVIPAKGHYLGVNSVGYSLASYPAGNGTTATGDATYTTEIQDNAGIALFNTSTPANFTLANRLDAVGSTTEANTLFKEGTGYPALPGAFDIDYSFVRTLCPNNTAVFGSALGCGPSTSGLSKDSNANQDDFIFVDTNGISAGAGQRLGAPGPENLSSPNERNSTFGFLLLDATLGGGTPPNRVRDLTSDPPNNSTFGTIELRRRIVNNTGAPVTRLRFRINDITTFPAPATFADLRTRTSSLVVVTGVNDTGTCSPAPAPCTVNVQGTTLEQPPSQANGGAFNSSYSAGTITLATPLAPGASVNVRFLFGIQQTGNFRVFVNVEALP